MNAITPYILIAPTVMAFLGCALMVAWNLQRRQRPLLWMSLCILANALALGVQSVLKHDLVAVFAPYTGVVYLAAAWWCSYGIAQKFRVPAHPRIALALALVTLAVLGYFSYVQENLVVRTFALNIGISLIQLLPVVYMLRRKPVNDPLITSLYWTYVVYCAYSFSRPFTLVMFNQLGVRELIESVYWFTTLLSSILFNMAFAFLLLAAAVRSALQTLQNERDLDPLTQLLNRRALMELVEERLSEPAPSPTALVMCDIDHFKHINDTWGHDYGDHVLREVAQCLKRSTRNFDLVARFGGEEFVLLLPNTNTQLASQIAQRIQAALAQPRYQLPDQRPLTMSFGIAAMQPLEEFHEALKRADIELYRAKQTGRNCVMVA